MAVIIPYQVAGQAAYCLQPAAAAAAPNNNSKCQVYESPKQPVWNPRTGGPGYIGGKDEWFKGGYDSGNWGYSSHKFGKSKAWKQYGSYYNYAGEDGKYTRYYKVRPAFVFLNEGYCMTTLSID